MKKIFGALLLLFLGIGCAVGQFQLPLGSQGPGIGKKTPKPTSRTLTGLVLEKGSDAPIPNAVVYLKNTKTLTVKSFFAQKDGSYRFPELSLTVDYEIYADKSGKKSDTKTLSQFDDRASPNLNLHIDINK